MTQISPDVQVKAETGSMLTEDAITSRQFVSQLRGRTTAVNK